jgi:hypothetical protein
MFTTNINNKSQNFDDSEFMRLARLLEYAAPKWWKGHVHHINPVNVLADKIEMAISLIETPQFAGEASGLRALAADPTNPSQAL